MKTVRRVVTLGLMCLGGITLAQGKQGSTVGPWNVYLSNFLDEPIRAELFGAQGEKVLGIAQPRRDILFSVHDVDHGFLEFKRTDGSRILSLESDLLQVGAKEQPMCLHIDLYKERNGKEGINIGSIKGTCFLP
jgi:hypothetical protein